MTPLEMRLSKPGKLPYVVLYHNTTPYMFVVDTGSTLSWTTPEVAGKMLFGNESRSVNEIHNLEYEVGICATLRVYPIKGTAEDDTSQKFQVKLWCGEGTSKINEMNNHVKDKIHGILGSDFLIHNAVKIDMNKLEMYV